MITSAPTADRSKVAALRADLDQLRNPIPRPPVRQRVRSGTARYTRWIDPGPLPPLLTLLREAAAGQNTTPRGPERRHTPRSRPPGPLDAQDLLARVYVGLSGWHAGLNLPSPPHHADWQRWALMQLHSEARRLSPSTIDAIATDVHNWWRWTATAVGLSQQELIDLRHT